MTQNISIISVLCTTLFLISCDEGRLYDEYDVTKQDGYSASMHAIVSGMNSWTSQYSFVLAGFSEGNDYALISKTVTPDTEGVCDVSLSGIPAEVSSIEFCVIDRLRRRVASFMSLPFNGSQDNICLDCGEIDASMFDVIQHDIFNTTCTQCHGATGYAAAQLNLTEGHSWASMVSVQSVKMPGFNRIEPGNSGVSVLYRILASDESAQWSYNHSVEIPRQEKLEIIKNWIDGGARRN